MKFYRVECAIPAGRLFEDTFAGAKNQIKAVDAIYRANALVIEVEIKTDKANIFALLNDAAFDEKVLRKWRGTARGGLVLVAAGAEPDDIL